MNCILLSQKASRTNDFQSQPKDKAGVLSVNQVELHPWLARPDIVDWCQSRGVVLEAYSPLVRSQSESKISYKSLHI